MTNFKKSSSTNLLVGESPQEFARSPMDVNQGKLYWNQPTPQMLPISVAKKQDLVSLVESDVAQSLQNTGTTTEAYQTRSNVRDALAEPDAEELMEDENQSQEDCVVNFSL